MDKISNAYKILVRKPDKCRWEKNSKMNYKKIKSEDVVGFVYLREG